MSTETRDLNEITTTMETILNLSPTPKERLNTGKKKEEKNDFNKTQLVTASDWI